MHEPRVIPAQLIHVPAIMDIYNDAVLHSTATFDTEPKTLPDRQSWLLQRPDTCPVIVALAPDDTVLGWGSLSLYSDRLAYRFTVEDSIYIRPDARGQGLGTLLLARLLHLAAEHGYHSMIAKITDGNLPSVRLHEKFGFEISATLREVGRKFDRWLDVLFMQKLL